ncbi:MULTISPECIES: DoxX family protein [Falsihalocynthiibacter]|uniref:DoxX family protein n=1 Tax=Falsihalocynthiibacter TaxID=2854182 RepID=UPI0030034BB6
MHALLTLYDFAVRLLTKFAGTWLLPTLARFTFAATLLVYYWNSALTKLGDGVFGFLSPSAGAYAQIFPKAAEAVSYDTSQLGWFYWAVAVAGMWAEFILPALIVLGLFTRLGAIGMIGFIFVQSLTDLYGHGGINQPGTLGAWFDGAPDSGILDQRLFWITVLVVLVIKGAGPLSVDRILLRRRPQA